MAWQRIKLPVWFHDKLTALVAGCPKHPGYRALLKPRTKCSRCRELFKIASGLESQGYLVRKD